MSSRNTLGQVQGTKAMTRNVKSTLVEGRKALLVQINWTTAPVIKTTVRKNFKLSVLAMDTKTWMPIQRGMMNLKAGQVIHYTQSREHPNFYYITIVGESCTCIAGLYKQECHHQTDAVAFEAARTMKAAAQVSQEYQELVAPIVASHLAAHLEDDLRMAGLERMYENICSESCDDDVPPMPPEILALYLSEPGTMDEAPRAADIWQDVEEYEPAV